MRNKSHDKRTNILANQKHKEGEFLNSGKSKVLRNLILNARIKHHPGDTSVKIYDKFGSVLRIEATSNDVSEMQVFRDVQSRLSPQASSSSTCRLCHLSLMFNSLPLRQ